MRPVLTCVAVALGLAPACWPGSRASTDLASTADLVARYPRTEMNATAATLVRMAVELGLDLEPWTPTACSPWSPRASPGRPNSELWWAIREYLQAPLEKPESSEPPPRLLVEFTSPRREPLESIRDFLVREPPPRWALDIETWWEGPEPSPDLDRLRSVILAEALSAVNAGDPEASLSWLEAAWKIDEGLRSRPGRWWPRSGVELAILRRVDTASEVWSERLARVDPRADARTGQLVEAWNFLRILAQDAAPLTDYLDCVMPIDSEPEGGWVKSVRRFVLTSAPIRAYGRAGTVEATARLRRLLDRLVELDPCELMAGAYPASIEESNPWWNRMGTTLFVDQHSLWKRVGRALLEAELTAKVLEAKRQRARTGAWPESIPGIERSTCRRGSWRYSALRGGGVLLEFVSDGEWRSLHEPGPLRFCRAK